MIKGIVPKEALEVITCAHTPIEYKPLDVVREIVHDEAVFLISYRELGNYYSTLDWKKNTWN